MEKFYDFITNPDWWIVLFTLTSTIAVIVIAVVQTRIQKQQAKAQEYELYKELYVIIQNTDWFIEGFIVSIYRRIKDCKNIEELQDNLEDTQKYLYKIKMQIEQRVVDFHLKTKNGKQSIMQYLKILGMMRMLIAKICDIVRDDESIRMHSTEVDKEYRYIFTRTDEMIQKAVLVSRFTNIDDAKQIDELVERFFTIKGNILDLKYAESIADNC